MLLSTLSSTIPSKEVQDTLSIAARLDITAALTPVATFMAQLGFAPSHTIPVRFPIMF